MHESLKPDHLAKQSDRFGENTMQKVPICLFLFFAITALISGPALGKKAHKSVDGAKLFAQYCASCHVGGGNIVKPKRGLAGSKKLENILEFKAYLSSPPGHMPYYHNVVTDKEKLSSLYEYCKSTYKDKVQKQSLNQTLDGVLCGARP